MVPRGNARGTLCGSLQNLNDGFKVKLLYARPRDKVQASRVKLSLHVETLQNFTVLECRIGFTQKSGVL